MTEPVMKTVNQKLEHDFVNISTIFGVEKSTAN